MSYSQFLAPSLLHCETILPGACNFYYLPIIRFKISNLVHILCFKKETHTRKYPFVLAFIITLLS
jgi:hypothetical protein